MEGAYHLTPPFALDAVVKVLAFGERKYGGWSYLSIPWEESFRHMLAHSMSVIKREHPDNIFPEFPPEIGELAQVATRAMMALEVALREHYQQRQQNNE